MTQVLTEKTCFNCKASKPLCCFYDKKNSKDGKENQCQDCRRLRMKYVNHNRGVVNIPLYKRCSKCDKEKSYLDFYKAKSEFDGLASYCKVCTSFIDHLRNKTNKRRDFKQEFQQSRRIANRIAWCAFFQTYYGNPCCGVCSIALKWDSDTKIEQVVFDHRHGGEEIIKGSPSHWYSDHELNETNKAIWLSCDFGILCAKCNTGLPTSNRDLWIKNVVKYIGVQS